MFSVGLNPTTAQPGLGQRLWRIVRLFAVVLVFLLVFIPFALGLVTTWALTRTFCDPGVTPDQVGMPDYERVAFEAGLNRPLQAYFVRGSNGATIIIPPALGTGAGNWRPEYIAMQRAGYNLLNIESRNCQGLPNTLGYAEADDVGAALAYLATRPDVDMNRIGIHGFSAAGAASLMAAARYPELKAVIATGGYHNFSDTLDAETGGTWYGALYSTGARLGYWLSTGQMLTVLNPIATIHQIAPRPILLVYGTHEPSLPGARLQQTAAGPNADLWVVEGASHGMYWAVAAQAFEQRMIAFLDTALGIHP
jgi:dienelactone hydrolase